LNKLILLSLLFVLFVPVVKAQSTAAASVRYTSVEAITYEPNYPFNMGEPVACTHFVYTFAMWKVNQWADKAYFTGYVQRDDKNLVFANWTVGFSVAGGLQSMDFDRATDFLSGEIIMAEFPYESKVMDNAIDGVQTYRFYRMHFYFNNTLFQDEIVTVSADYMKAPVVADAVTSGELEVQGATTQTLTGDEKDYLILGTNPEGFTFGLLQELEHAIPEVPFGTLLSAGLMCSAAFLLVRRRKK